MASIGILGAGTWGIALARMLANSGHRVIVWSAFENEINDLKETRRQKNLPGIIIPASIDFTCDLQEVCRNKDIVLFAVPSLYVRKTAHAVSGLIPAGQIIVDVAKGLETETLKTLSEVILSEIPEAQVVALSGPTHAEEVAQDLPTTIVAAHEELRIAEKVQSIFSNSVMRVYTNTDIRGVELCGALKNIIALAVGIAAGLGYGDNTKAALITRGLAEITRLGIRMGCAAETFAGLAGVGDLIVTATSRHSRNYRCGVLIGQGLDVKQAVQQVGMVVEGLNALSAAVKLSDQYHVEMPIVQTVEQIVHNGMTPDMAVQKLMSRDQKAEQYTRF